jgi:hypothetical protein
VRTTAKRLMGTERGSLAPSRVGIVLHDLRRTDKSEARRGSCGRVVMEFLQRGVRRERRDTCVWGGEVAVILFVSVWVGDVCGVIVECG